MTTADESGAGTGAAGVGDPLLAGSDLPVASNLAKDWVDDPWDSPSTVAEDATGEAAPALVKWRAPIRALAVAVVSAVLLVGLGGWWAVHQLNPGGATGEAVVFTVNPDDDLDSVTARLAGVGLVGNQTLFKWWARTRGDLTLVPGYYSIRPGSSAGEVIDVLSTPPAETFVNVTFPEGMTVAQMAARLAEKMPMMDAARFVAAASDGSVTSSLSPSEPRDSSAPALEGLLFPDTYQISGDDTEARVVQRLAATMERVAGQVDLVAGARLLGRTPHEVLVVASMIEREAKVPEDRPKIARVIYNRLAAEMTLDIDATLKYVDDGTLSWTELKKIESPYNSYVQKRLPPTPIANPGRAAIEAALAPSGPPRADDEACAGLAAGVKCDYFYYVLTDAEGRHKFATTLAQHEANIEEARASGVLP